MLGRQGNPTYTNPITAGRVSAPGQVHGMGQAPQQPGASPMGTPQQASDLSAHDGIAYNLVPDAQQWPLGVVQGRVLHKPHIRLATNNGDMILKATEAGLGIAMLPTFLCHEAIAAGRLQPILQQHTPPPMALYALYPSRRHLPQRVRALVEFLVEWFAGEPPWEVEA